MGQGHKGSRDGLADRLATIGGFHVSHIKLALWLVFVWGFPMFWLYADGTHGYFG